MKLNNLIFSCSILFCSVLAQASSLNSINNEEYDTDKSVTSISKGITKITDVTLENENECAEKTEGCLRKTEVCVENTGILLNIGLKIVDILNSLTSKKN